MTLRRSYVDTRFGQTHLRAVSPARAAARPVFCLHPQPLCGLSLEPLLAELGRTRLALAPDLPGFGMSEAPARQPSLQDYLGWIADVAAAQGLERYDVLGWLTGARLVVPLAAAQPETVVHVVLIGAPVLPAATRAALPPHVVPSPARDGSHLHAEWERWMAWWPADSPLQAPSDLFATTLQGFGHAQRAWLVNVTRSVLHEDYLPQLTQPVLVINPAGPLHEATSRLAPHLRNGRIVTTEAQMFPLLTAAHVAAAGRLVAEFLDGG